LHKIILCFIVSNSKHHSQTLFSALQEEGIEL
jgi:hypothetical protein